MGTLGDDLLGLRNCVNLECAAARLCAIPEGQSQPPTPNLSLTIEKREKLSPWAGYTLPKVTIRAWLDRGRNWSVLLPKTANLSPFSFFSPTLHPSNETGISKRQKDYLVYDRIVLLKENKKVSFGKMSSKRSLNSPHLISQTAGQIFAFSLLSNKCLFHFNHDV